MKTFLSLLCLLLFVDPIFGESRVIPLDKAIDFSQKNATIGYIEIGDKSQSISQSTYLYVKSALDHYRKEKPLFILLKLNTPGGQVFAAQKICDALKEIDLQDNIPVVAFIDNWAISAGAMIAFSCRFITTTEDASMGAAEPIIVGEGGKTETASEKVNSAIRTSFANYAKYFGRSPEIAKAMVYKEMLLVYRDDKVIELEEMKQVHSPPDILITKPGQLLTLDASELLKYKISDLLVPSIKHVPASAEEKASGSWPFSKELLSTVSPFSKLSQATVKKYQMDWRTNLFYFLTTPLVTSLLTMGLIVGFYLEFTTPGFGFFGSLGLFCLVLLILSSTSVEASSWLELILIASGILMLFADWTFLPTGGILSFFGGILFIAGFLALVVPGLTSTQFDFDTQTVNAAGEAALERLGWLSFSLIASLIIISLAGRFLSKQSKRFSFLVLTGNEQEGYTVRDERAFPSIGSFGTVTSTLRPTGKILVNGIYFDAISKHKLIEKGKSVIVVGIEGNCALVTLKED